MKETAKYYKLPKYLFSEKLSLSSGAKLLFVLLLDRCGLSEKHKNEYCDDDGKIFVVFGAEKASQLLGCSKNTVTVYMNELKKAGLISTTRKQYGGQRIYIHDFCDCDNENRDFKHTENVVSLSQKPCCNKTEYNKTDYSYKRQKEETLCFSKPSLDIDLAERRAFMNPMRYFEKKNESA